MSEYKYIRAYSAAEDKTVILERLPPFPKGIQVYDSERDAFYVRNGKEA